eukprot:scaffold25895_cov108-Cylindrotheca_fusiformis.AAC.4
MNNNNSNGDISKNAEDDDSIILGVSGLVAQPIVWVSLYFVATTGAGLPSGPFGLIGALEGISYLAVVALVSKSIGRRVMGDERRRSSGSIDGEASLLRLSEQVSWFTLFIALLALLGLVVEQGCVPNAKPILDYSAYLPVCSPEDTPGLFGS